MTLKAKNQNDIISSELRNLNNINYIFSDRPINRVKTKPKVEDRSKLLTNLRIEIENIQNCELKNNANNLVLSDGNQQSKIMIVGEGPGQAEDEIGKPFAGEVGTLLNKMLNAIKISRNQVYITNVVNYRPPNNRKPEPNEISKYSVFLRKHISIINPKILILMGSTAMESLFGSNIKITKERGSWKDIIINNKTYLCMITFHPAYLLRQPENKKYSWTDLKEIRKKIDQLKIVL